MEHKQGFYEKYVKRVLDVVLSLILLVLLSPIILVIAILVRIKLGSPVIFCQERPGKDEKIFKLFKFRTMTNEKGDDGNLAPDNVRLTSFGKKLRNTSFDELPELFNILKGDMSFVGPRPLLVRYLPYYTEDERHRHDVRPGLTGLAQVSGRNFLKWEERFEKDLEYAENITIVTDIKIIIRTIKKVIFKEDIMELNKGKHGLEFNDLDIERKKQI